MKKKQQMKLQTGSEKAKREDFGRFHGVLKRERIHDFLGFDSVDNGMIVRKERK